MVTGIAWVHSQGCLCKLLRPINKLQVYVLFDLLPTTGFGNRQCANKQRLSLDEHTKYTMLSKVENRLPKPASRLPITPDGRRCRRKWKCSTHLITNVWKATSTLRLKIPINCIQLQLALMMKFMFS
jgi:hypothetical protein